MKNEQLRGKIVLLGIKAMEQLEHFFQRAEYVSDELTKAERGYWGCCISDETLAKEKRAAVRYWTYDSNKFTFRIGGCRFIVHQQTSNSA